jgi:hypothetical protein
MKIEDLSFCTEVIKENTDRVNGGAIPDFSSNLFDVLPGVPLVSPSIDDIGIIEFEPIEPIMVEPTDFGVW